VVFLGSREELAIVGYVAGNCPRCETARRFAVYDARRKLTIYVLLKVPLNQQMVAECTSCGLRFGVPKDEVEEFRSRATTADEVDRQLADGRRDSDRARRTKGTAVGDGPTHYQILMIDPAADDEIIDAVYKRLALRNHPDRDPSPDALARMQAINEAKRVLSDPDLRAAYDRALGIDRPTIGFRADDI
jgi:hypothetical protein